MFSKTWQMMVRGITLIPRKAAKLLKPNTGEVAVSVFALGTLLGYSQQNLMFIYKQFLWETARGTSNVFKTYNNAFGMNAVNVRQTTQTGTYETSVETLGIYPSVWSSVVDYFLWADYWSLDDFKRSDDYAQAASNIYHLSATYSYNVGSISPTGWNLGRLVTLTCLPLELLAIQKIWKSFKN